MAKYCADKKTLVILRQHDEIVAALLPLVINDHWTAFDNYMMMMMPLLLLLLI